jgi:hypothetical protein
VAQVVYAVIDAASLHKERRNRMYQQRIHQIFQKTAKVSSTGSLGTLCVLILLLLSGGDEKPSGAAYAQSVEEKLSISSIAHIYHGVALDSQLREIPLDRRAIEQIQDSLIELLSAPRPSVEMPDGSIRAEQKPKFDKANSDMALRPFQSSWSDTVLAKQALIQRAVGALPPDERKYYQPRVSIVRAAIARLPGITLPSANTELSALLSEARVSTLMSLGINDQPLQKAYVDECAANSVPIPPNWPDAQWISRGILPSDFTFANFPGTVSTEVVTYEDPNQKGICYALPRKDQAGAIQALGIICQSRETGKACFWDNIDGTTGTRIVGPDIKLNIESLQNGFNLEENCTQCHRGGNAYLIHPKTPLGALRNRNTRVRYTPIGQATWSNPPAWAEVGSGACSDCHEIAEPNSSYCSFLRKAAEKTMPQPEAPAGWLNPTPEFKSHIDFLKTRCP